MTPIQGIRFKPIPHRGIWILLSIVAVCLLISGGMVVIVSDFAISGSAFWLGLIALISAGCGFYLLYQALALFSLSYHFTRNGLEIYSGATIQRIPINHIQNIEPVANTSLPQQKLFGFTLPTWWCGEWQNFIFYTTALPQESLLVQTPETYFVISPQDKDNFIRAWKLRLPLGPTQIWEQDILRLSFLRYHLWFDPFARRLAGGAILLCLILVGATLTAYAGWPQDIPLQLYSNETASVFVNRNQLLWIPIGGVTILVINLALGAFWHRKDPLIAYLFWFMAILVQIGLWLGIRMVTG